MTSLAAKAEKYTNLNEGITAILDLIVEDFERWSIRTPYGDTERMKERVNEFAQGVTYTEGSKYIKIITGNSVWGFVVVSETDKKFSFGDILKAASWNAPARNFPRGNLFTEFASCVRWTGAQ